MKKSTPLKLIISFMLVVMLTVTLIPISFAFNAKEVRAEDENTTPPSSGQDLTEDNDTEPPNNSGNESPSGDGNSDQNLSDTEEGSEDMDDADPPPLKGPTPDSQYIPNGTTLMFNYWRKTKNRLGRFTTTYEGMYFIGACVEAGKPSLPNPSGTSGKVEGTTTLISNDTKMAKVAYYWGILKNHQAKLGYMGPGAEHNVECMLQFINSPTLFRSAGFYTRKLEAKVKRDIATALDSGVVVPNTFELYFCKRNNNKYQNFVV